MAKHRCKNKSISRAGEKFVRDCIEEMGCEYLNGESDLPSIDGQIQIYDHENDCNYYLAYQVKTGSSYIRKSNTDKYVYISNLKTEDIYDWMSSNIPMIIIWVNLKKSKYALWGEARYAKPKGGRLRVLKNQYFNKDAFNRLLDIVREHAETPLIHRIKNTPLYPTKVSDVKSIAWEFYSDWRNQGSTSVIFNDVAITLKCWRHITRVSLSQKEIIHRLLLLPLAKEVLEHSRTKRFLRELNIGNRIIKYYALTGLYRTNFQANIWIEVIIKQIEISRKKLKPRLHSFYEKRIR